MSKPEIIHTPGLVDLHVHLREPSSNKSETIESGTRAALLGGYALVADMPNNPGNPTWSEKAMLEKHSIAISDSFIPIGFYAGWQPETNEELTELSKMSHLAVGLKLYGAPTTGNDKDYQASDFLPAVSLWHEVAPDKPIMFHAGKENLKDMINLVARKFGHALHVCHVNDPKEVLAVKKAKDSDLPVTCGVCPHHLLKTSHDTRSEGWFARMQPPLAQQADAEKLMDHLAKGDIDVIETDHAPHPEGNKWQAEMENPGGVHDPDHTTCFGVPGIEYVASLMFYQAKRGLISMERLVDAMSTKPAQILGVNLSRRTRMTWDMEEYRIDDQAYSVQSEAGWTPYLGKLAVGKLSQATINGKTLVRYESVISHYPRVVASRSETI